MGVLWGMSRRCLDVACCVKGVWNVYRSVLRVCGGCFEGNLGGLEGVFKKGVKPLFIMPGEQISYSFEKNSGNRDKKQAQLRLCKLGLSSIF